MKIATFLRLASSPCNPTKLLNEHRSFLLQFPSVYAIVSLLDNGRVFPTQALQRVMVRLSNEKDIVPSVKERKVKEKTVKASPIPSLLSDDEPKEEKAPKLYTINIIGRIGETREEVLLSFTADTYQQAERIAYNKVVSRGDALAADIVGQEITTRVPRDVCFRYKLGKPIGGVMRTKSPKRAGGGLKSKAWTPKFSWG